MDNGLKSFAEGRIAEDYYYSRGAVRLSFNSMGRLVMIVLAEGYLGALFEDVRIGDRLNKIQSYADINYDDADELHHLSIDEDEIGLSIYAEEYALSDSPEQKILRVFVHDGFL